MSRHQFRRRGSGRYPDRSRRLHRSDTSNKKKDKLLETLVELGAWWVPSVAFEGHKAVQGAA